LESIWILPTGNNRAGIIQMKKVVLVGITLACSAAVTAADTPANISGKFNTLSASCIGLDNAGMKRCMDIIARHVFGPLHALRTFTLAEKTAIDAVMGADKQAVLVVLPDGSFVIGQTVSDRLIGIPCEANPCPGP
jgi:hypothetical protein